MKKNSLLGVSITNETEKEILQYILISLQKPGDPYYIATPNPEILVYGHRHPAFKRILNNARLGLPDGLGVILAGKFLHRPFHGRITGVDFMEKMCQEVAEKPITVGFLGGKDGVAEKTAECLQKQYPGLKVAFVGEEWDKNKIGRLPYATSDAQYPLSKSSHAIPSSLNESRTSKQGQKEIKNGSSTFSSLGGGQASSIIREKSIDILFVAYGFPKQEEFMAEYVGKIPVKVMMGVGGSFDYISGKVFRAPQIIRLIGFEWLFRLLIQPWRIRRQLALLEFIFLVIKEKFASGKSSS